MTARESKLYARRVMAFWAFVIGENYADRIVQAKEALSSVNWPGEPPLSKADEARVRQALLDLAGELRKPFDAARDRLHSAARAPARGGGSR